MCSCYDERGFRSCGLWCGEVSKTQEHEGLCFSFSALFPVATHSEQPHFCPKAVAWFCTLRPAYKMSTLNSCEYCLFSSSCCRSCRPAHRGLSKYRSPTCNPSMLSAQISSFSLAVWLRRYGSCGRSRQSSPFPRIRRDGTQLPSGSHPGLSVEALLTHKDLHQRHPHQTRSGQNRSARRSTSTFRTQARCCAQTRPAHHPR